MKFVLFFLDLLLLLVKRKLKKGNYDNEEQTVNHISYVSDWLYKGKKMKEVIKRLLLWGIFEKFVWIFCNNATHTYEIWSSSGQESHLILRRMHSFFTRKIPKNGLFWLNRLRNNKTVKYSTANIKVKCLHQFTRIFIE